MDSSKASYVLKNFEQKLGMPKTLLDIRGKTEPMAEMLRLMSLLSTPFNNNLLDKSPGKEKKKSNTPLISKWGNTVKDAKRRELCWHFWWMTQGLIRGDHKAGEAG